MTLEDGYKYEMQSYLNQVQVGLSTVFLPMALESVYNRANPALSNESLNPKVSVMDSNEKQLTEQGFLNPGEGIKEVPKTKPNQVHHYASDKNSTYTSQFNDIAKKYDLDLDDAWNKGSLPHQGRHPNAYHDFILDEMKNIDNVAKGDKDIFLDLYENDIKSIVRDNPDMLYSAYWKNLE